MWEKINRAFHSYFTHSHTSELQETIEGLIASMRQSLRRDDTGHSSLLELRLSQPPSVSLG